MPVQCQCQAGTLHFEPKQLVENFTFLVGLRKNLAIFKMTFCIIGGIKDILFFFLISLLKIENFFFEEMLQLCIVEETRLKKFFSALVFALYLHWRTASTFSLPAPFREAISSPPWAGNQDKLLHLKISIGETSECKHQGRLADMDFPVFPL